MSEPTYTRRRRLQAGIVGAGLMGRWHAHAAAASGAQVAAVFDADHARAEAFASRLRGCHPAHELAELLGAVDVVHICTPTPTHLALARQAIALRRHVLIEKPLAATAGETIDLMQAAVSQGVHACPVHQFVFQDGVQEALAQLATIGTLRHVDVTVCSAGADGAGEATRARIAHEILPHPLSILQRVLPFDVSELRWFVSSPVAGEIRALADAGQTTVQLLVSMSGRPTINRLSLIGTRRSIDIDLFHGFGVTRSGAVSRVRKMTQPFVHSATTFGGAAINLMKRTLSGEPAYPGLRRLVEGMYDAIDGRGPCPISPAETISVARALDQLRLAAAGTVMPREHVR